MKSQCPPEQSCACTPMFWKDIFERGKRRKNTQRSSRWLPTPPTRARQCKNTVHGSFPATSSEKQNKTEANGAGSGEQKLTIHPPKLHDTRINNRDVAEAYENTRLTFGLKAMSSRPCRQKHNSREAESALQQGMFPPARNYVLCTSTYRPTLRKVGLPSANKTHDDTRTAQHKRQRKTSLAECCHTKPNLRSYYEKAWP